MSINQHYKLSDATAVLHFIVGYNNEMEVQEEAEQAAEEDRVKQRERERGRERQQSRRSDKTNHISIKMRKAFCGCRCLHSLLLLLLLPFFPLSSSSCSLHCTPFLLYSIVLLLPTVSLLLIRPVCSVPCVLCAFLFMRLSLCLCLAVYRSLAVGTALCMQKT